MEMKNETDCIPIENPDIIKDVIVRNNVKCINRQMISSKPVLNLRREREDLMSGKQSNPTSVL